MDIGLFCDTFPLELDGVGVVVKNYAENFIKSGHACRLIVPKATRGHAATQSFPCPTLQYTGITLPVARQYRAGVPALDLSYLHKRRRAKMDVLHAHSPFGAGLEAIRLARIHGAPLIGTFHSKFYDDFYNVTHSSSLSQMGVKIVVSFFNACDEVWAVNHATADVLKSYGYTGDIIVMPNGTDIWSPTDEDRRRAEVYFSLRRDCPTLLFVGQQNWKKNIRHIIEALALYRDMQPDFQMVMAGQGPHLKEIQSYVEALHLSPQFLFTGQIMDRQTLLSLYARADLLVFPSLYDNASMVVNEAAASGTPSLLIKNSCTAECVRDCENGFLCEDHPEDICNTIARALQNPALLRKAGAAARQTIPISWASITNRVLDRYAQLLEQRPARATRRSFKLR